MSDMIEPDANGWMPIESAPHDGSKVLLWLADEDFSVTGSWRVLDVGTEDEWAGFWLWEMDLGEDLHCPTHWQPLPKSPVTPLSQDTHSPSPLNPPADEEGAAANPGEAQS